jgi:hypothetical protein
LDIVSKISIALASVLLAMISGACSAVTPVVPTGTALPILTSTQPASATPVPTDTPAPTTTLAPSATVLPSSTFTASASPTITLTATITLTPTNTVTLPPSTTPTRDFPDVVVNKQANCRYGPGVAYLYRWGLYPGETAEVHGRNWNGSWYWIKPYHLDSHCWASEIVFDVQQGDPKNVPLVERRLPRTTFAGPPGNVQAVRIGDQVQVTWDIVPLSDDKRRGYMIEAMVCQNGAYIPLIVRSDDPTYTLTDQPGCSTPSHALLYTAEKHGYSDPVEIPWP